MPTAKHDSDGDYDMSDATTDQGDTKIKITNKNDSSDEEVQIIENPQIATATKDNAEEMAPPSARRKAKEVNAPPSTASSSSKLPASKPSASTTQTSSQKSSASAATAQPSKPKQTFLGTYFSYAQSNSNAKGKGKAADTDQGMKEDKLVTDWESGAEVPYAALATTFEAIDSTRKRSEKSRHLASFLIEVIRKSPTHLVPILHLCLNRVAPEHARLVVKQPEIDLVKVISQVTGVKVDKIKSDYRDTGDLVDVFNQHQKRQTTLIQPKSLTTEKVFVELLKMAKASGKKEAADPIQTLLRASKGVENIYVIRSILGNLRIGLAERTVLSALGEAIATVKSQDTNKEISDEELQNAVEMLEKSFSAVPSFDIVVPILLDKGFEGLHSTSLITLGVPVKPMLAAATTSIAKALESFQDSNFVCDYKYDGERVQVHLLENKKVKVFSRNLNEDVKPKYPDLFSNMTALTRPGTETLVLDCEVVAWNSTNECFATIEKLAEKKQTSAKSKTAGKNKKKAEDEEDEDEIVPKLIAFDLLYFNGKSLLDQSLSSRRDLLLKVVKPIDGSLDFATTENASTVEAIDGILDKAIRDGCEGLMLKTSQGEEALYEPGLRSSHWLKIKPDYLGGLGDSMDLVVIGADSDEDAGSHQYHNFVLAAFDAKSDKYHALCRLVMVISEEESCEIYETLKRNEISKAKTSFVLGDIEPPKVFFKPKVVWEISGLALAPSSVYPAAKGLLGDVKTGITLLFPRFLKVRTDKSAKQGTSVKEVAEAWKQQDSIVSEGSKKSRRSK